MAAPKKLTIVLSKPQEKKHVTRYDAEDENAALQNAYIGKEGLKSLGNPKKLKVTIEAA